jgi:ubiquinone/menaquinone biosynthesis C-methylase UbiE
MEDPRTRFTRTAENYRLYRPLYPPALFEWLREIAPGRDVADLGSGTGIASRQLAAHGFRVVGIEPNDAMRDAAEVEGDVRYVKAEASATTLPPASVDLVTAAQAFHWFSLADTLVEVDRILRPGGVAVAFWNMRDRTHPFVAAYTQLLARYSSEVGRVPRGPAAIAAIRTAVPRSTVRSFPNAQRLDRVGLRGRAWSSSYVAHGVADAEGFNAGLDALFDQYQVDDCVEMAYRVDVVRYR